MIRQSKKHKPQEKDAETFDEQISRLIMNLSNYIPPKKARKFNFKCNYNDSKSLALAIENNNIDGKEFRLHPETQ